MIFKIGRNNFALTVMVPYDCSNNCAFCTSKAMYHKIGTSIEDVKFQLARTFRDFDYPIKDVVFTGGEPTADLDVLRELIDIIPEDKNIYINTTLPSQNNIEEFSDLVNDEEKIKGINVSRHMPSYAADKELYDCDIVGDETFGLFNKPIRINCVLTKENMNDYRNIISRWEYVAHNVNQHISLCFRENFAPETIDAKVLLKQNLHNPYTPFLTALGLEYLFVSHTQCNVCDTTRFMTPGGLLVAYHRGLEKSSILSPDGGELEVNDLVIFPDGRIGYDWKDVSLKTMHEFEVWADAKKGIFRNLLNFNNNCSALRDAEINKEISEISYRGCGGWIGGGCGGSGC